MYDGHLHVPREATLLPLLLLVFVRLVCLVLIAGVLVAQGTLFPKPLPLEYDFFGVVAAVFFLLHLLRCGIVCELT